MGLMTIGVVASAPAPVIDHAAEAAHWAQQVAAWQLMEEISRATDQPITLVWQALCTVPDNMLTLLDSPQGWTALAGFVAAELGVPVPDFMPAVH